MNKKINHDKARIIDASNKRRFSNRQNDSIPWIERLLQTGLAEHRKYVIRIILVPYLTNIRHLTRERVTSTINQWLSKCNICRPLGRTFNSELKLNYHIKRCEINRNLKPIRFKRLLERNPELYKIIEEICDHG